MLAHILQRILINQIILIMDNSIFFLFFIISLILFIGLFVFLLIRTINKRKIAMNDHKAYDVACAGSTHGGVGDVEKKESSILLTDEFLDYDGKKINVDDYFQFIVSGESMKLSGIHDKDIVFVPKDYSCGSETLPSVFVLKKEHPKVGEAKYKIRRGWKIVRWQELENDYESVLQSIMSTEKFNSIKENYAYPGDGEIIKDFKDNRWKKYVNEHKSEEDRGLVMISTTLHLNNPDDPKDDEIDFSIHPVDLIVGRISFSYSSCN